MASGSTAMLRGLHKPRTSRLYVFIPGQRGASWARWSAALSLLGAARLLSVSTRPRSPASSRLRRASSRTSAPRGSQNGTLWNIDSESASLRLDVGCFDHLAPLLGLGGN